MCHSTDISMLIMFQGVTEVLCEACDHLGWKSPTKIQVEAIPVALQGKVSHLHLL